MWPIMYNELYIPSKHQERQQQKQVLSNEWMTSRWLFLLYTVFSAGTSVSHPLHLQLYLLSCQIILWVLRSSYSSFPRHLFQVIIFFFFSLRSCQQLTNLFVCQLNAIPASRTIASKIAQLLPLLCLVVQINTFQIWFLIGVLLFPKRHVM